MTNKDFTLNLLMDKCGLHTIASRRMPSVWGLGEEECVPFFAPDIKSRFGGFQILGVIGVLVTSFEQMWNAALDQSGFPNKFRDTFLLSSYITNLPSFQRPPVFQNNAETTLGLEQSEWLEGIREFLLKSPFSLNELENSFASRKISGVNLRTFYGHPVKWQAFGKWASKAGWRTIAEVAGERPLDRIEPYERLELR